MYKRAFGFMVLAFAFFGTQCWAGQCSPGEEQTGCSNTFSPGSTTNTYDFSGTNDGVLVVQFDTVLTTFTLTVNVNHNIDQIDLNEFPAGTVCVQYEFNGNQCDQYDFTGSQAGPNGVPVKNQDYKGLITLTLSYFSGQQANSPAFGHAPGEIVTITEDILTNYSVLPQEDPTMRGGAAGLSSVVALDEPLTETDNICFLNTTGGSIFSAATTKEIEVTFQLFAGSCGAGTAMRDKTARFSLSTTDSNGNEIFPPLVVKVEGNKFHWENKAGLNEFDFSTVGLPTGKTYTITVISSKAPPTSVQFTLNP